MNKQEIEKAIRVLKSQINNLTSTLTEEPQYPFRSSIETQIESTKLAISALEQQLNGGWIPISERWPDKSGYYLTTYREWTDGNYLPKYDDTKVKILRYQDAIFRLPVCCDKQAEQDTHREVLAWRELPEIWKEDKHERSWI